MLNYQNNSISGELWLRDANGEKQPANILLKEIFKKYQTLDLSLSSSTNLTMHPRNLSLYESFYSELTSNQIVKFDVFYDCFFLQTKSGCIFEKYYIENDLIKPFSIADTFTPKHNTRPGFLSFDTHVDYWFDETEKKVYFSYISNLEENKNFPLKFSFILIVNEFDCLTGNIKTVLFWKIEIPFSKSTRWDIFDFILESPKITFNDLTKTFNVSFLIKNLDKQFGIISINFNKSLGISSRRFSITEINGYVPFFDIIPYECRAYPFGPNELSNYRVLSVASDPNDPSYKIKFILSSFYNEDNELVNNYLVLE